MSQDDIGFAASNEGFFCSAMEYWELTNALRFSKLGTLQQCWKSSKGRFEWRDVPVLGTPEYEQTGLPG